MMTEVRSIISIYPHNQNSMFLLLLPLSSAQSNIIMILSNLLQRYSLAESAGTCWSVRENQDLFQQV